MAYAVYPATLPNPEGTSDYTYTPRSNIIASPGDTGLGKTRRRFTWIPSDVQVKLKLTQAQQTIMDNFFNNTLSSVLPFTWVDFRTGNPMNYKFVSAAPASAYVDGEVNMYDVTLMLVTVP